MSATPLVLLHGYPFDHTMWDKVVALLDCPVIAPDLRGFGKTPPGNEEPSLDLMADDVSRLLDGQQVQRAIMVGFSMGGYAALSFAERYPQRLVGLGLVNSQPQADSDEARAGRRAMIEKVQREGARVAADAAIPKLFAAANPAKEELASFVRGPAEQ